MTDLGAALNAIHAWAELHTGLSIVWADEKAPQKAWAFGRLRIISGPIPIGGVDELRLETDLGEVNEEVLQTVIGQRRLVVSLQVQNRRDLDAAYNATEDPSSIIAQAQTSLRLPSVIAALDAADVAVLDVGDPVNLTGLETDQDFTARHQLDITFGLALEVSERTGYINRALVTSDTGAPSSVDLDDEPLGG